MPLDFEKFITETYLRVLGHPPDEEGLRDYVRALSLHMHPAELESSLRRSTEYMMLYDFIKKGKIPNQVAYINNDSKIVWIGIEEKTSASKSSISMAGIYDSVVLVTTWGIRCGIATYSEYLLRAINNAIPNRNIIHVQSINDGVPDEYIDGKIVHLQHEYGIMPKPPISRSKTIVTFHTVLKEYTIRDYEQGMNIIGYVAHFQEAKNIISSYTKKPIFLIPHGSVLIPGALDPNMKQYARELLRFSEMGIVGNDECAFVFGFQSGNKNYEELVQASKNIGLKLIISGAVHQNCTSKHIVDEGNVIFLGRYLSETEVDLFALASDILLFHTIPLSHYSCSGALHRVVGAGRPVICSRVPHYADIIENEHCLKYDRQDELEEKIVTALKRKDDLGKRAYDFAQQTSWAMSAKKHLNMYESCGYSLNQVEQKCNSVATITTTTTSP